MVANTSSEISYGPRELSDAELDLDGGGGLLGWLETAVSATYAIAGALLGVLVVPWPAKSPASPVTL